MILFLTPITQELLTALFLTISWPLCESTHVGNQDNHQATAQVQRVD